MSLDPKYHAPLTADEQRALIALKQGAASESDQVLALGAIIKKLCRTNEIPYEQNPYDTAFRCGMGAAGSNILRAINAPITKEEVTDAP